MRFIDVANFLSSYSTVQLIVSSHRAALTLRQPYATGKGDWIEHVLLRRRCPLQCDCLGRRIGTETFFGEGALREYTTVRTGCRRCGGELVAGREGRLPCRGYRLHKLAVNVLASFVIDRVQSFHLEKKGTFAVKDIARTLADYSAAFLRTSWKISSSAR